MMNKKGMSPWVATVLIIAFTVALAAVIMVWGQGFLEGLQEVESCGGFNESYAPVEEHCESLGMEYVIIGIFDAGCIDGAGEVHYYSFDYFDGLWWVGNTSYKAKFTCDEETVDEEGFRFRNINTSEIGRLLAVNSDFEFPFLRFYCESNFSFVEEQYGNKDVEFVYSDNTTTVITIEDMCDTMYARGGFNSQYDDLVPEPIVEDVEFVVGSDISEVCFGDDCFLNDDRIVEVSFECEYFYFDGSRSICDVVYDQYFYPSGIAFNEGLIDFCCAHGGRVFFDEYGGAVTRFEVAAWQYNDGGLL